MKIKIIGNIKWYLGICFEFCNKTKNKSDSNLKGNKNKSVAEKTEYQLFLDVGQFIQQTRGFINGIQMDERMSCNCQTNGETKGRRKNQKKKTSIIGIIGSSLIPLCAKTEDFKMCRNWEAAPVE